MKLIFKLYQWILWNIVTRFLFINLYLKRIYKFHLTADSDPIPKPPFLLLSNHGTFFDPWIIGSYSRYPMGYMTNDDGFTEGIITRWYLKSIGSFPKKKGASDFKAMKTTLSLLKRGKPVCIFPEGQSTWDGETQLLYPGIEKLLKRSGCPLVIVRLRGNFITKPWWACFKRNGSISVTMNVHSVDKIKSLTNEELFDFIRKSIYQNDIKDPGNRTVSFTGHHCAEGLERLLWICRRCEAEDTLSMTGDTITCNECGGTWHIDAYCRITPSTGNGDGACEDLKDWVDFQKENVRKKIAARPDVLTHNEHAQHLQPDLHHRFRPVDEGSLQLSPTTLTYKNADGESEWPIEDIEEYVIQKKDIFEFRHGSSYHRFIFTGKSPMKWVFYLRYLKGYEICEQQGHL